MTNTIRAAVKAGWLPGLMAANLLLALLINVQLLSAIGKPYGGFLIEYTGQTSWYKISNNTPYWMPALLYGGLKGGDPLKALNGQPFGYDHEQRFAEIYARGETSATVTVTRNNRNLDFVIPIRLFSLADVIDSHLPDFLNGLGYWLLALVIYRTRPCARLNRMTAVAANMLAVSLWLRHYAPFSPTIPIFTVAESAWHIGVAFVGVTVIHFALLITDDAPATKTNKRAPWWLVLGYAVTVIAAIAFGLDKLIIWPDVNAWTPLKGQLAGMILTTLFWASYGVGMGVLVLRMLFVLVRTRSRRMRRQLIVLLLGVLVSFLAFMREGILPDSFFGAARYFTFNGLDMRLLQLGIPIGMTFIIVRYQTLRGASNLFLFVLLLTGSALAANIGAWLIRLSVPDPGVFTIPPFIAVFVVAFLFGALWAGQPFWQNVLSRLFRWESHSLQAIQRFSESIATDAQSEAIPAHITAAMVSEFSVEQAALWLWDAPTQRYQLASEAGGATRKALPALSSTPEIITPPGAHDATAPLLAHPLLVGPDAPTAPAWLAALTGNRYEAVAALDFDAETSPGSSGMLGIDRRIGLLALGKRWDEETFHERDLEVLALIAQQSALFIVTARQIDELRRVPQRVTEAQERERAYLAQELHDTVQQFLGGLPLYLESVRRLNNAHAGGPAATPALPTAAPSQADALLRDCIAAATRASQDVRQLRQNLSPIQIQNNLSRPLGELVRYAATRYELDIHLDCAPAIDDIVPNGSRHALYRTIQQALDNVGTHAHAKHVDVTITVHADQLAFSIKDDGQGFSAAERIAAANDGHFGLISMHSRITALGGELSIVSETGRGTMVSGQLPLKVPQ